jgi:type I restriction enzyme S subunit
MKSLTFIKWNKMKIGDLAEITSGGTPSSIISEYWDGNIQWATLPDLRSKYLFDTQRKITELGLKNSSAKLLPINTVIFSSRATIGEISITKIETTTNQGSKNFICFPEKVNYDFFYYLLKSKVNLINSLATGATYKEINKSTFSNIEVLIPNLSYQKIVSDVLSAYDNLILNNEKRIKVIDSITENLYRKSFVKNTTKTSSNLDAIAIVHRGKSYSSEDISSSDGIPFVNLKCMNRNGGFRYDGLKSFSGDYKENHVVKNGDMVMAVTDMTQDRAIVARTARIPILDGGFGVISMDLVKIEPKDGVDKTWLYSFLRYSDFGNSVKEYANGANVLHLNPARISEYKLDIPSIGAQKGYSEITESMFDLQDKLSAENRRLQEARDFLIPQLVGGKLEVK